LIIQAVKCALFVNFSRIFRPLQDLLEFATLISLVTHGCGGWLLNFCDTFIYRLKTFRHSLEQTGSLGNWRCPIFVEFLVQP
jgi:hypothetical protein